MGFEIINQLKKEKGITNAQLAKMSGVTLSTLDKITSGANTNPKLETLQAICKALGCSLDDFDTPAESRRNTVSTLDKKMLTKYHRLTPPWRLAVDGLIEIGLSDEVQEPYYAEPVGYSLPYAYDLCASAGTGEPALDIAHFEPLELKKAPPRGAAFVVRVSGDSMEPEYSDGDKVFIRKQETLEIGEIGLFVADGDAYIKRLGRGALVSLNPAYGPIPLNEDMSVRCYGKVIGKE